VHLVRVLQLTFGVMLALICMPSHAVSLGQVQMQSGLGQPIYAEIPIYDTNNVDLQTLTIQFASDDAFRRLGLNPNRVADVQLSIVSDSNGKLFVQLKSDIPYNEPVLAVLLEAQWGDNGRLVKELTALVDPPFIAKAAVQTINVPTVILSPVVAPPTATPINPYRTPTIPTGSVDTKTVPPIKKVTQPEKIVAKAPEVKETEPTVKKTEPVVKPNEPDVANKPAVQRKPVQPVQIPATPNNELLVEQGDNLSNIAIRHSKEIGSRVSLNQMMSAIQRANTNAFIKDNPNLLKKGSILRLPDEEQVLAMMPEDSANLLKSQWAKNSEAQPAPVLDSANKLSSKNSNTKKTGTPSNGGAEVKTKNQGRLKIVPTVGNMNNASSQSGASKSGQGQELRAESAQSQEEIATRQAEIVTLKTQLNDAASLQVESKRLIELQNSQIKLLTQRMQDLEKGTAISTTSDMKPTAVVKAYSKEPIVLAPWYYNTNVVIIGLLLIAVLLGVLLKRKK
jgi:pilus assembly protein FimV